MAHVVDTRSGGGEFVVLGDAFTLPSSSNASTPPQGSLRFNPVTQAIETYYPATQIWATVGGGGSFGGSVPVITAGSTVYLNVVTNGTLIIGSDVATAVINYGVTSNAFNVTLIVETPSITSDTQSVKLLWAQNTGYITVGSFSGPAVVNSDALNYIIASQSALGAGTIWDLIYMQTIDSILFYSITSS
ncbi:unnamed protein product [Sphagnum tenellum]